MPSEQADVVKLTEGEEPKPEASGEDWVIRRPKRVKVTAAEAIQWTEDFAAKRKEQFIASVRKSKS